MLNPDAEVDDGDVLADVALGVFESNELLRALRRQNRCMLVLLAVGVAAAWVVAVVLFLEFGLS